MKRYQKLLGGAIIAIYAAAVLAAPPVQTFPGGLHHASQTEVLVLNSAATNVPATSTEGRLALEIFNNGPNTIYCKPAGTPVVNKARPVSPGSSWYIEVGWTVTVKCIAGTADQVTTAATIVTEIY